MTCYVARGDTMDIYKTVIEKSTPDELAELIKNMATETDKYRTAFYAAKAFIDSHVADPDLTPEMVEKYDLYHVAIRGC
jgi:hypothetical protein